MNCNYRQVSTLLAQRAEEVARYLLPQGRKEGQEWCVGSVNGEPGRSLKVHLIGEKAGIFCDFADSDSGDLLDLWALSRKITLVDALRDARQYLGLGAPQFEAYRPKQFARPSLKNIAQVSDTSQVMSYLVNERKLSKETIRTFKIGEQGRQITFPYYREGELIFIKQLGLDRDNGKKRIHVESGCEPCLFGWHTLPGNSRTVTLTEGEIDAMSLYQYGIPALSVPFGGGTGNKHKWIEYEFDRLARFDEIYLNFDNDAEGEAATFEIVQRLGRYRCRIVKLPKKDANECLMAGISKDQILKFFDASVTLDPEELQSAHTFVDEVIETFYPPGGVERGYQSPWEKAFGKIVLRPDDLSVWTGINGQGKSLMLGQICLTVMQQGARVCIASLEIMPKRLLMNLTRQAAAVAEPSVEYIHAIHKWYEGRLWLFNLVGTAKYKRLLEVFLYARQRYGVDFFVIDSFMKLDIAEDDYRAQKEFMSELCDFKNQYNCQVHIIVHPRKGADETRPPGKLDNKGTGAISDLADNCFTVWRNKRKEEIAQLKAGGKVLTNDDVNTLNSADCLWCCDKQRNGDWEGKVALWFDPKSKQYMNGPNRRPNQMVEYSSVSPGVRCV